MENSMHTHILSFTVFALLSAATAGLAYVLVKALRYHAWEIADTREGELALKLPPLHPRVALRKPHAVIKMRNQATGQLIVLKQRLGQLMPSRVSNQPPEAA